jgi:hypothetical protein
MFRRLWDQFFGIKSDREVAREVLRQPRIRAAREDLRRSKRLLASLEALEGEKKIDE